MAEQDTRNVTERGQGELDVIGFTPVTGAEISGPLRSVPDLVIDINGYFAPPGSGGLDLFTVAPCRALDTRNPAGS